MAALTIRPCLASDAQALARIYNYYIQHTVITFEEELVSAPVMASRVAEVQQISLPWLVGEVDGALRGYAYATRWKARSAYRYAVETGGMHVAIGGAALPNAASVALHLRLGFEQVATFRQVGFKHERWVDVAYWQKVL